MMEWIFLVSLTDEKVTYRFQPDYSKEYGVVSLMRKTGKRVLEQPHPDAPLEYAGMAWAKIEDCQKNGSFPEKAIVAWY